MAAELIKINTITNNSCPNSRAFNCPLLAARNFFAAKGFKLNFFFDFSEKVFDCDIIFVNSNVFRSDWQKDKGKIFSFLEKAKNHNLKIIWFDTTDSTWCTQFEALPYVDIFLKSQLLKDRKQYLKPFRTGRIFTDFFDDLYDCNEDSVEYPAPKEEELEKLDISWNTCFENYTHTRYMLPARIKQKLRPKTANILGEKFKIKFIPVMKERNVSISCRVGLSHSRKSVIAHRQAIMDILKKRGVDCGKIPLNEYFNEMKNAVIGIGPFGVGEITLRDYEIIICGSTLVKPDMTHLETWPELFKPDETFVAHKWDLSDFEEVISKVLNHDDWRQEIALKAQNAYREAVSGMDHFAERLIAKIKD
jgi:hypothetical protein